MGLFSWLFPSPEAKLAKARAHFQAGRFADARLDALELGDLAGAAELAAQAEHALSIANLDAAVSWAEAGDGERVAHHLELAEQFQSPELAEAARQARRRIRAIQEAHASDRRAASAERAARELEVDPRFKAGRGGEEPPLPDDVDPAEADEVKARLALHHDALPEDLRPRMLALGPAYARAVLDLEEGRAEEALTTLLSLADDEPLVLHQRARAARLLRDPAAAARAWVAFARHAGGHRAFGNEHTAVLLAVSQAESGDPRAALATLDEAGRPPAGAMLRAQLLEGTGDLKAAEQAFASLAEQHGNQSNVMVGLARVRAALGQRVAAMRTLEASLNQTVCTPGRCGYRPPDLATHRLLATLYLEDGLETSRALELADVAGGLVQQPTWEDLYLEALAARARGDLDADTLVEELHRVTPEAGPGRERLVAHLAPS